MLQIAALSAQSLYLTARNAGAVTPRSNHATTGTTKHATNVAPTLKQSPAPTDTKAPPQPHKLAEGYHSSLGGDG